MDEPIIDSIYESAFCPEIWPHVLQYIADVAGANGGAMFVANVISRAFVNWTSSPRIFETSKRFFESDIFPRQERLGRFVAAQRGGFVTESEVYASEEEILADVMYREFLWPAGFGYSAGTAFPLPTGDVIAISLERRRADGPVEPERIVRLNALRPHLARAALMSARLSLERARAAAETLALINLPALVFEERGKVLAANALVEALTGFVRWRAGDRFSLTDGSADALLRQALSAPADSVTRSFAVRGEDRAAALVAHIIPIRRAARDVFVRAAGVLVLTPVTLPNAPTVELVQSLFDFTPSEALVAHRLAAGQTLKGIAGERGVSIFTVRTQLNSALAKTGCARQAELVALLQGSHRVAPFAGPAD